MEAMLIFRSARRAATAATTPWTSLWKVTRVGRSPLTFTEKPSISWSSTAPPPTEAPTISMVLPSLPEKRNLTELGWAPSTSSRSKRKGNPRSTAVSRAVLMPSSSGSIPRSPATRALSVPWPLDVKAKLPLRKRATSLTGSSPQHALANFPSRAAPAVWLDDGPIITGPMMSRNPMRIPPRKKEMRGRDGRPFPSSDT